MTLCALLSILPAVAILGGPAGLPTSTCPDDDEARLAAVLHIGQGETRVGDLLADLSKQTGLDVQAEEYIRSRRLIVAMPDASAREVLDALADLEEWKWFKAEAGRYIVERPPVRPLTDPLKAPEQLTRIMPRDLRDYAPPKSQLPFAGLPPEEEYKRITEGDMRAMNDAQSLRDDLMLSVKPRLVEHPELSFQALQPADQERLLLILVLDALRRIDLLSWQGGGPALYLDAPDTFLVMENGRVLAVKRYLAPDFPVMIGAGGVP